MLTVIEHPTLDLRAFTTAFPIPVGQCESSSEMIELLTLDGSDSKSVPVRFDDTVKPKVRDLLRHGGYKPTGRGKPASEYLRQAIEKGILSSINLAVDACNVVSFHSGLPISVIDLDRVAMPLSVALAPEGSEYVFNATGQTIKLDGLLCLFDADGPCANGVKDSQRTKTSDATTRTLSIIWGTVELEGQSDSAMRWYRQLLENAGATTELLDIE